VEVTGGDKHNSLLFYEINCGRKFLLVPRLDCGRDERGDVDVRQVLLRQATK
jgi:hypothetical protein